MRICFVYPLPLRGVGSSTVENRVGSISSASVRMTSQAKSAVCRRSVLTGAIASTIVLAGLVSPPEAPALSKKRILAKAGPEVVLENGIRYRDITVGKGYSPQKGDTVAVHYSLFYDDLEVESSRESQGLAALPLGFSFGAESGPGSAMKGLNLGMEGMKVGGLRLITIPSKYAYGEKGRMPLIPPNADIDMAVSLLSCKRVGTNPNSMLDPNAQIY